MSLPIITADQRLAEPRGIKGCIFGKSGIGKTSLLWTLDPARTLFMDLEAGDLAIEGWPGDSIRPRTWADCRDFAVFIGGANPSLRDEQPYSPAHHAAVCQKFGDPAALDRFETIFVDSITVAGRLCFQWCKGQPEALSEKTGKPDVRGAYGLHGREMIAWLTHLQHTRAKNVWFVGILDEKLDDFNRKVFQPQIDGSKTELGSWDEALLSAELNDLLAEDFDLSLVGFSDGELDKLLAFVPEGDGQEGGTGGSVPPVTIPEPPRNPASRTGDLWILGDHRLLCGDSTSAADVRRLMNGERAILFATDPPYLVDYDGSNHPTRNKDWSASYGTTWDDSSQGAELYDGFIAAAVAEAIADNAAWYCWHASRRQAMLEACWEKAGAFVHQQIIWVKDRGVLTRSHYLWKHEPCFMGWRRPNRPPRVAEETLASTWALPSFAKDERPDHPTPKPLDAFGIPMRQHVARGGLCYEPFSGSGSQIMAGEANGRRVFAMEISPAYIDVAAERWQASTGRDAILDGAGQTFTQVKAKRLGETPAAPVEDKLA